MRHAARRRAQSHLVLSRAVQPAPHWEVWVLRGLSREWHPRPGSLPEAGALRTVYMLLVGDLPPLLPRAGPDSSGPLGLSRPLGQPEKGRLKRLSGGPESQPLWAQTVPSPGQHQGLRAWVPGLVLPELAGPPAPASRKPHSHQVGLGPFSWRGGGSYLERGSQHPRAGTRLDPAIRTGRSGNVAFCGAHPGSPS